MQTYSFIFVTASNSEFEYILRANNLTHAKRKAYRMASKCEVRVKRKTLGLKAA